MHAKLRLLHLGLKKPQFYYEVTEMNAFDFSGIC